MLTSTCRQKNVGVSTTMAQVLEGTGLTLTLATYTHVELHDQTGAIEKLPQQNSVVAAANYLAKESDRSRQLRRLSRTAMPKSPAVPSKINVDGSGIATAL